MQETGKRTSGAAESGAAGERSDDRLVEQGMQLTATLPDIMPDEAGDDVKPTYEEIRRTLRVPIVNMIFRTLANYPEYLNAAWKQIRPVARTREFEHAADEIREQGLLTNAPDRLDLDLASLHDVERLRAFNETIFYVLPKLLLVTTAWADALEREEDGARPELAAGAHGGEPTRSIPLGVADGTATVKLTDPSGTTKRVSEIFGSIKQQHGMPVVSSYYRGLANWPDFLDAAWSAIREHVGSAAYLARRQRLMDAARTHTRAWHAVSVLPAPGELDDVRLVLTAFQSRFIPEMLLDVAMVQRLLSGPGSATGTSRFSAAA